MGKTLYNWRIKTENRNITQNNKKQANLNNNIKSCIMKLTVNTALI